MNKCTKCKIDNCEACFSRNFCTKCKEGLFLHKGRCYSSCPEGFAALNGTMECSSVVQCELGEWGSWGPCTKKGKLCGFKKGSQNRTREALQPPPAEPSLCPPETESRTCTVQKKPCAKGVKAIVERLKSRASSLLKEADNFYNLAIIKLPVTVRKMKWMDYFALFKCPTNYPPLCSQSCRRKLKSLRSSSKDKKKVSTETISEETENIPPIKTTTKKGKATTKKVPPSTRKPRALSVNQAGSGIRKSTRKVCATPAVNALDSSFMGPTPLITPRFNSRLPKTPAVRNPRHRERVYSISVNGSPIAGNNDLLINIPIGNGESMQILASEMNETDLSQFDEHAVQKIKLLLVSYCYILLETFGESMLRLTLLIYASTLDIYVFSTTVGWFHIP
ncbi:BORE1 protein, partial [Polyodon spathula]|nr:BORE1 protein [Polyodon spathula]